MAANHYTFTSSSQPASDLKDALRGLAVAWDKYTRQRGILIQKKDLSQSGNAQFALQVSDYGYPDTATAAASFAEIDAAFGASDAAITQMLNRHL